MKDFADDVTEDAHDVFLGYVEEVLPMAFTNRAAIRRAVASTGPGCIR
jgi:hypothetical protein